MKKILNTAGALAVSLAILVVGCSKKEPGAAEAGAAAKPYPLDFCVVSDEKLGEMGKPHVITYEGREIKFCCGDCEGDFRKEPAKFLAKIDAAAKK